MATKTQLTETIKSLQAQLDALKAERDSKSEDKTPIKEVNGVTIVVRGHGLDGLALFQTAIDNQQFVSYGAVAEAIGVLKPGEQFKNRGDGNHMDAVLNFIRETEVDHLVVNKQGRYGRKAPVDSHHARLKDLGYEKVPGAAQTSTKKKEELSKEELLKMLLAALN